MFPKVQPLGKTYSMCAVILYLQHKQIRFLKLLLQKLEQKLILDVQHAKLTLTSIRLVFGASFCSRMKKHRAEQQNQNRPTRHPRHCRTANLFWLKNMRMHTHSYTHTHTNNAGGGGKLSGACQLSRGMEPSVSVKG